MNRTPQPAAPAITDTERLDWLESQLYGTYLTICHHKSRQMYYAGDGSSGNSLRAALDASMSAKGFTSGTEEAG